MEPPPPSLSLEIKRSVFMTEEFKSVLNEGEAFSPPFLFSFIFNVQGLSLCHHRRALPVVAVMLGACVFV